MIRKLIFILSGLSLVGPASAGEPVVPTDCSRTVVRVHSTDRAVIDAVARWTEPWEIQRDQGFFIVDVDAKGMDRLEALGVPLEIDVEKTEDYCAPRVRLPRQTTGIPGYPCYRTVEETFATAQQLAIDYPTLAEFIDVGDSWEKSEPGGGDGYDMMVLKLTNSETTGTPTGDGQGKPVLFVTSAIHAREYTTAELMTRFAEYLLDNYGVDADATWLLDEHEIHLMLHTNPDGRKQAEGGASWRKNTDENYCGATSSSRGADLNRNFEFQWGCNTSSDSQCDETYRGPDAASEPEVQAVEAYARALFPDQRGENLTDAAPETTTGIYLDIHSYSELVLWPWGFTEDVAPNGTQLQTLGRKLAFFNGYRPQQAISLYPTCGTTDDFVYGDLGVAAYTFELGTAFFQDCSTFEDTILPDNLKALVYAAKVARTPYLTPAGPEIVGLDFTGGSFIAPGTALEISTSADDTRFNNPNDIDIEPTGTVAAAHCSLDAPPWTDPAPDFFAVDAADGAFDAGVEDLSGTIDTIGLSDGRHTLFCRARDDGGQWGPVSARFFWIVDPATAPHIAGTVRSAADGSGVEARIAVGTISTGTSDAGSGAYDLMIPEGTYTVTATPTGPDFGDASMPDVAAVAGSTTTVDFDLQPFDVTLSDNIESGNVSGWTAESPWAVTTESAHSGTHSWTDSPGSEYGDGVDTSLISPVLDLSAVENVELRFFNDRNTESGYDYCILEYSTDGGSSWSEATRWDGSTGGWIETVTALPALDGISEARIRFRLTSDGSVTRDGWHVDDIVVRGTAVDPPFFADGFEDGTTDSWSITTP